MSNIIGSLSVVLTAVYAWLTYQILRANRATVRTMQEQTESMLRPFITIWGAPIPGTILFVLSISNTGRAGAERLRLSMDRPFHQFGNERPEKNIAALNAFTEEIEMFPPGAEMSFHLGTSIQIYGGGEKGPMPQVFKVTATYNWGEKQFREVTTVDLRPLENSAIIEDASVKALEKIADTAEKMSRAK